MIADHRQERIDLPRGVLEREILKMLWNSGDSRVWDVVGHVGHKLGLTLQYTTVATILNRLCSAGHVRRVRTTERSFLYSACVSPERVDKESITKCLQTLFVASHDPRSVLAFVVDLVAETDEDLLAELKEVVTKKRKEVGER